MGPGGSSWVKRNGQFETTQSLSSWNVTAGAGYRLHEKLWLVTEVGMAGFRGATIESNGNEERLESSPSLLLSVAIQFRP